MMALIFFSYVSKATYLYNGTETICIKGSDCRKAGTIAEGFEDVSFNKVYESMKKDEDEIFFLVKGNNIELCNERNAYSSGYKPLYILSTDPDWLSEANGTCEKCGAYVSDVAFDQNPQSPYFATTLCSKCIHN